MRKFEHFCVHCGAGNPVGNGRCFSCGHSLRTTIPLDSQTEFGGELLRGRYRRLEQIGEGGYSAVYRAEDLQEKRIIALKAISLRDLTPQEQIEATDTFNREVHFLSHLQQRNLPQVYEHFSEQECWYLVMEFIDGSTLEQKLETLKGRPLPYIEVMEIGIVLCSVLSYLHGQEPTIIFRDLKPGNIMLTRSGQIYLIDFGIARRYKAGKERDTIPFGSPGYAAPEQYGRAQTQPTADIYSLGAILHQLCSGRDPADQPFTFAPLAQPELAELSELLLKMVDLDASKRPQSSELVLVELKKIESQLWQKRGIHAASVSKAPPAITYVASPTAVQQAQNAGQLVASTATYTSQGQVQVIQQQNQYYQGPAAAIYMRNKYAIASSACCITTIILPVVSCTFVSSLSYQEPIVFIIWVILACLGPGVGGILFGILGKRRARQFLTLRHTLKSAHNSLIISSIFLSIYLAIFFLILYTGSIR